MLSHKALTKVPPPSSTYDYTISTTDAYGTPDCPFTGPFAHIRGLLDYSYHAHYTTARQEVQDRIILFFLQHHHVVGEGEVDMTVFTDGPPNQGPLPSPISAAGECGPGYQRRGPWVVFTAGPMGAGKSHSLKWMARRGFFPLDKFVHADPDLIRDELPEMEGYIKSNPETAGTLTHKEAGYISEVLIRASLERGKDILVQGSLRDSAWHAAYFSRLREDFPSIRIAILHVTASRATVLERASKRAEITKRVIPTEVLLSAIEKTPEAVEALKPSVDYCVTIDNDDSEPLLASVGQSWDGFRMVWSDNCVGRAP